MLIKLQGTMKEFKPSSVCTFDADFHREKQWWESEIRNWEIIDDPESFWTFLVKDSDGNITRTSALDCECDSYSQLKIGTCVHMCSLKRTKIQIPKVKNVIYYDSYKDILYMAGFNPIPIRNVQELNAIFQKDPNVIITTAAKNKLQKRIDASELATLNSAKTESLKNNNLKDIFKNEGIQLYQYQVDSIIHMLVYRRCILALKMGLGKSLSALACMKHIESTENVKLKVLIVCPTSLKIQWEEQVVKYLNKSSFVCGGGKKVIPPNTECVIVNYESLYRIPEIMETEYDVLILDEVQKVKNKETAIWKATRQIKSKWCYALSGTVVENSVEDFIAIMEIIDEPSIAPKWRFVNIFCNYEKHKIYGLKPEQVGKLRTRFANHIIRCNIPKNMTPTNFIKQQESTLSIPIEAKQLSVSNDWFEKAKHMLAVGQSRPLKFHEKAMLNAYMTKARMASNDIRLLDSNSKQVSEKTKEIANTISNHVSKGQKVVVFSQWVEYLKLIAIELENKSIKFVKYDGSLNIKQKNKNLSIFQNDSSTMVFLSSDAGGVGLDGLQLVSNIVIHCEASWNPAKVAQRNGRLIRIGQKQNTVFIYNFMSSGTIEEEFMIMNNSRKDELRNNIVD